MAKTTTNTATAAKSTPAAKTGKRNPGSNLNAEARNKGYRLKSLRGTFNKYLNALSAPRNARKVEKAQALQAQLDSGVKTRLVPFWDWTIPNPDYKEGGNAPKRIRVTEGTAGAEKTRAGSKEKTIPLLPHEKAKITLEIQRLESESHRVKPELRAEFLAILPEYAEAEGFTPSILADCGVPHEDLVAAGLVPAVQAVAAQ